MIYRVVGEVTCQSIERLEHEWSGYPLAAGGRRAFRRLKPGSWKCGSESTIEVKLTPMK